MNDPDLASRRHKEVCNPLPEAVVGVGIVAMVKAAAEH